MKYLEEDMFNHLENFSLLDDMMMDYTLFESKHTVWINTHQLWRKFIRSN